MRRGARAKGRLDTSSRRHRRPPTRGQEKVGKLGALRDGVSNVTDPAALPPAAGVAREGDPEGDTASYSALRTHVAARLLEQADDLAGRWIVQARDVAPRDSATDPDGEQDPGDILPMIGALASACRADHTTADDGVALGLAYGTEAFERHVSLHHMLKGLDLLAAMTLYVVERAASEAATMDDLPASAADGVRLCRQIQQVAGLLAFAAAKGYTQAVSDGLKDRLRHLRHDLRNPLGTIKSVLALMDDESMSATERSDPKFRAMAKRNARSLDELIVARLSDAAAVLPTLAHQSVSLRAIACAVRRSLRAEAEAHDVSVTVAPGRSRVRVDAVGLELLLHTTLLSLLREAPAGDELAIGFGDARGPRGPRATISITARSGRVPFDDATTRERLVALVKQMGGTLDVSTGSLVLSVPIEGTEGGPPPQATPGRSPSGQRQPRHDIGSASQRDDGEAGAF